ncbi:MAG TPA: Uma2 family endonuclease [Candidatus Solibacter sp.]|nr:Uma2 family endonuclease [Candidatus Solibacter sp.]
MATLTVPPAENKVILHGVSWETYERLSSEHQDSPGTHFTYDEGELEIMVVSLIHEEPNRDLAMLVEVLALAWRVKFRHAGSTTFKREILQKGFEPDTAFYFAPESVNRGRSADAESNPRPDLIIEVEVSTPALDRFPIFAAFGIPEVWRYAKSRVIFYRLEGERYVECASSLALPALTAPVATRFMEDRSRMDIIEWTDSLQEWARQQR